ncbi:hypothetical protein [Nocardia sp. NPDC047648]|uniref:hypothetical protein n=1 Tax=Nocardia sp. NPDC047648 TaxID=3155625 RepID=UPI0033D728F1
MDLILARTHVVDWVIETHYRSVPRRKGDSISSSLLRQKAIELAARIAPLRIVNERKSLELNLKNFPFGKFNSLEPTVESVAEIAIARSNTTLTVADLVLEIEGESTHESVENDFLVGDHDFFRALARVLAKYGVRGVSDTTLFNSFISALTCHVIMDTNWYAAVVRWCETHYCTAFACPCEN